MGGRAAEELLQLPVRVHGIQLGRPVDLILDVGPPPRVVGFDVLCGDDEHRFLPLAAATIADGEIEVRSTLTLLERPQLTYYRERGDTLRAARGAVVERRGVELGRVHDLVLAGDGAVEAVALGEDGERRVALDGDVRVVFPRRPAA
jgi:hypothetical protein